MNNPMLEAVDGNLAEILSALPTVVDFYHLGKIELNDFEFAENERSIIAFQLHGDRSAVFIFLFEKGLDDSAYTEFGNLLVSRIATELYSKNGLEVTLSPPRNLDASQLQNLIHRVKPIRKTYTHFYKNTVIPIETLILPTVVEEVGYV